MNKHGAVTHTKLDYKSVRSLTTDELAEMLSLQAASIRKRVCQTGAYFCLRPVKLPNGRLMWPADSLEQLSKGS